MPDSTSEPSKQRFQETSKFLPVFFVTSNICVLYFIYLFLHCIPLLNDQATRNRGIAETVIFNIVTFLLLVCYAKSILVHPGSIPDNDEDPSWEYIPTAKDVCYDNQGLQEMKRSGDRRHCKWCNKYKPDRCHHCRVCRICILRMDHHCPWIYNCVGFRNHKYFFLLLFYSTIDCHIIVWTMMESLRNSVGGSTIFIKMFFLLFGETLAACMGLLVTAFFFFHVWLLLKAMTTIEFCEKQMKNKGYDSSVYDRGFYGNLTGAMGDNKLFWLCPWSPPSGRGLSFLTEEAPLNQDEEAPRGSRRKGQPKMRYGATVRRQGKKPKKNAGTGSAGEESDECEAATAPDADTKET